MAHSVLVVPVPQMEPFVRARHEHYDADYVSPDPAFAHAHITLLGPFVPLNQLTDDVAARVATVLAGTPAFPFSLQRVTTFPNGVVHLVPEPSKPFQALTTALAAAFPAYPPYAGRFPRVAPHLTLDALGPGVDEQSVRSAVAGLVPVGCLATQARLSWYEPRACRTLAGWPLGGAGDVSCG